MGWLLRFSSVVFPFVVSFGFPHRLGSVRANHNITLPARQYLVLKKFLSTKSCMTRNVTKTRIFPCFCANFAGKRKNPCLTSPRRSAIIGTNTAYSFQFSAGQPVRMGNPPQTRKISQGIPEESTQPVGRGLAPRRRLPQDPEKRRGQALALQGFLRSGVRQSPFLFLGTKKRPSPRLRNGRYRKFAANYTQPQK